MVRLRWILLPVLVACLYKVISPDAGIWADDDALFLGSAPSHDVRFKRNLHSYSYTIADGHGYTTILLDVDDNVDSPFYGYGVLDDRDMYDGLYAGAYGKQAEPMNGEDLLSASKGMSPDKTSDAPQSESADATEADSGGGAISPSTDASANETVDNSTSSSGTSVTQPETFRMSGTQGEEVKCEDDSSTFREDYSCGITGASSLGTTGTSDVKQAAAETEVSDMLGENDRQNGETSERNNEGVRDENTQTAEEEIGDRVVDADVTDGENSNVASDGGKQETGSVSENAGTNRSREENGESTADGEGKQIAESSSDVAEGTSVDKLDDVDNIQANADVPTEDGSNGEISEVNNVEQKPNNDSGLENNANRTEIGEDIDQLSNSPSEIETTTGTSEVNNEEQMTNTGQETNSGMKESIGDGVQRRDDGDSTTSGDARVGETNRGTREEEIPGSQNQGEEGTTAGDSNSVPYNQEYGTEEVTPHSGTSEGSNGDEVAEKAGTAQGNEQPDPANSQGTTTANAAAANEDDMAEEQQTVDSLGEQKQDVGGANEEQAKGSNVENGQAGTDQLASKETDPSEVSGDKAEEASIGSPPAVSVRREQQEQGEGEERNGDNKETGEQQLTGVEKSSVTPEQAGDTTGDPEEPSLSQVHTAVGETASEVGNDEIVRVNERVPGEQKDVETNVGNLEDNNQNQAPGSEIVSEAQTEGPAGANGEAEKEPISNVDQITNVGNPEESNQNQVPGSEIVSEAQTEGPAGANGEAEKEPISNVDQITNVGNPEESNQNQVPGSEIVSEAQTEGPAGANGEAEKEPISNVDQITNVGNPEESNQNQVPGSEIVSEAQTEGPAGANGEAEKEPISNVDQITNVGNPEESNQNQVPGSEIVSEAQTEGPSGGNGEAEKEPISNVDQITNVGYPEESNQNQVPGSEIISEAQTEGPSGGNGDRDKEPISNVDEVTNVGNPEESNQNQVPGSEIVSEAQTEGPAGANGEAEKEPISNVDQITNVGNPEESNQNQVPGSEIVSEAQTEGPAGANGEAEKEPISNVNEVTNVDNPEESNQNQVPGSEIVSEAQTEGPAGANGEAEKETISNVDEVTNVGNPEESNQNQVPGSEIVSEAQTEGSPGANGEAEKETISNVDEVTNVGNPEESNQNQVSGSEIVSEAETEGPPGANGEAEKEPISNVDEVTNVGNPEDSNQNQVPGSEIVSEAQTEGPPGANGEAEKETISNVDEVTNVGNPEESSLSQVRGTVNDLQNGGSAEEGQQPGMSDQVKEASASNNEENAPTRVSLDFPVEDRAGSGENNGTAANESCSSIPAERDTTNQEAEYVEVTTLNNAQERNVDSAVIRGEERVGKGDQKAAELSGVKEDKSVEGETEILAQEEKNTEVDKTSQISESRNSAESTNVENNQQNVNEHVKEPSEGGSEAETGKEISENDADKDSKNLAAEKAETPGYGVSKEKMHGGETKNSVAGPIAQKQHAEKVDIVEKDVEIVHVGGKGAGTGGVSGKLVSASEDGRLPDELVLVVNEYLRRTAASTANAGAHGVLSGPVQCNCHDHAEDISNNLISECCPCEGCDEYVGLPPSYPLCPQCQQEFYSVLVGQHSPHALMPLIDYSRHRNAKIRQKNVQAMPYIRKVLKALSYTPNNVYQKEVFKPVPYDKKGRKSPDRRPLPFIIERYFSIYGKTKPTSHKSVKMLYYNQKNGNRPKVYKLDKLQNT